MDEAREPVRPVGPVGLRAKTRRGRDAKIAKQIG